MSLNLFFLFLLSCTSVVLSTKDDEAVLLKIKKQLGNPAGLSWWVEGFNFCDASANPDTSHSYITCTSTGHVRSLLLRNFNITVSFSKAICQLTEIEDFIIEDSPGFSGPIPCCITKLPNLRLLVIYGTSLSGSVPDFHNHTNIMYINLSRNKLSGTIPPTLATLPNLVGLDLQSNYLTGTIPPGLVTRRPSSMLALSNNKLTGQIPKSYGSVDFQLIVVSNNQLSGDASFLFGKQKKTGNIELANNNFEFDLGNVEFSDHIYGFDLRYNKIYGEVPDSFATAAGLYYPQLAFNRLCGELPKGGNMWRFNAAVFEGNLCLCGNPLPPCSGSTPARPPVSLPPPPPPTPPPAPTPVSQPPM